MSSSCTSKHNRVHLSSELRKHFSDICGLSALEEKRRILMRVTQFQTVPVSNYVTTQQ